MNLCNQKFGNVLPIFLRNCASGDIVACVRRRRRLQFFLSCIIQISQRNILKILSAVHAFGVRDQLLIRFLMMEQLLLNRSTHIIGLGRMNVMHQTFKFL